MFAAVSTCAKYCRRHGSASQIGMARTTNHERRTMDRPPIRRLSSGLRHPQCVHAEQAVGPYRQRRPAAALSQSLEQLDRIFVAVRGVDRLAGEELNGG